MFVAFPTGNGVPLRRAPLACVLLVCAQVAIAAWITPSAERLRWERDCAERAGAAAPSGKPAGGEPPALEAAALAARRAAIEARDPFAAWGYREGAGPGRAVTALFVHADALHLVSNLLLLAAAGAFVEQIIGPAWLLGLFLGAGALALRIDAALGPPNVVLGASGGVAALLGAYCVLYRRVRLRWRYVHLVFLRPHAGRFETPCTAVAALWLATQAGGWAWAHRSGDPSIAYASHLAGFALGAAAAAVAERTATLRSTRAGAALRT